MDSINKPDDHHPVFTDESFMVSNDYLVSNVALSIIVISMLPILTVVLPLILPGMKRTNNLDLGEQVRTHSGHSSRQSSNFKYNEQELNIINQAQQIILRVKTEEEDNNNNNNNNNNRIRTALNNNNNNNKKLSLIDESKEIEENLLN